MKRTCLNIVGLYIREMQVAQIWVCDDLSASGGPEKLKEWFQKLKYS